MTTLTDSPRVEIPAKEPIQPAAQLERMGRQAWDRIVGSIAAVLAVALVVLGGAAIYGGNFGQDNVRDRLAPQNIAFPPADAMTAAEFAEVGAFAGATVDTGNEAEAFSRYIGLHLSEVNGGATYSETSAAAREEGLNPKVAADLQVKADTLFKGETLRAILLNGYGWWTVATIALYAGWVMLFAGLALLLLGVLGFRHSRKATVVVTEEMKTTPDYASANV